MMEGLKEVQTEVLEALTVALLHQVEDWDVTGQITKVVQKVVQMVVQQVFQVVQVVQVVPVDELLAYHQVVPFVVVVLHLCVVGPYS